MYHTYFGLREEPFGVSPDSRFFLATDQHGEALATLYYGLKQRRGFALLTGGAGLGKTSILVQLLERLSGDAETAYLSHRYFDGNSVLESILNSFGIEATSSLAGNHRLFYEFLTSVNRAGKTCVVVFDEAQNQNRDTLESIRMLSNFETPSEKLVQFVLAGQPPLAAILGRPDCEQIRQRLSVVARLRPLDGSQVQEYIEHRLKVAGLSSAAAPLFSPEAIASITQGSAGVPRNINTICFNALTLAYALNHRQVGRDEVAEALRDLELGPLEPIPAESAHRPAPPMEVRPPGAKAPGVQPTELRSRSFVPVPYYTNGHSAASTPAVRQVVPNGRLPAVVTAPPKPPASNGAPPQSPGLADRSGRDHALPSAIIAAGALLLAAGSLLFRRSDGS